MSVRPGALCPRARCCIWTNGERRCKDAQIWQRVDLGAKVPHWPDLMSRIDDVGRPRPRGGTGLPVNRDSELLRNESLFNSISIELCGSSIRSYIERTTIVIGHYYYY